MVIPQTGIVQLTVANAEGTPVKAVIVRFDLTGMPRSSRTVLRQRQATASLNHVRHAVHLGFVREADGSFRLGGMVRLAFATSAPVVGDEKLYVEYEMPEPRFFPLHHPTAISSPSPDVVEMEL